MEFSLCASCTHHAGGLLILSLRAPNPEFQPVKPLENSTSTLRSPKNVTDIGSSFQNQPRPNEFWKRDTPSALHGGDS